jgi:hypothetical protein
MYCLPHESLIAAYVCRYLSSKDLVEKTVSEHGVIVISGKEITVRRLLNPAKRIILSNVCPCIPHSVIENLVKTLGFVTVTPMSFLRAGIHREEYNHVLSFRRQIFVFNQTTLLTFLHPWF